MSLRDHQRKDDTFSFLPMDMSGKLIIKARLGDDIRKVPIHNEDITYDELILMLQRVFRDKLSNTDDVTLKYADDEGDLITIIDSSDLNLAKQLSRLLKITIFVHGKEPLPTLDASVVKEVRKELCAIRDKVNVLINAIDRVPKSSSKLSDRDAGRTVVETSSSSSQVSQSPQAGGKTEDQNKPNPLTSSMMSIFDPLKPAKSAAAQDVSSSSSSTAPSTHQPPTPQQQQQQQGSTSHLFTQQARGAQDPSSQFFTSPSQQQQQYQQQQQQASSYPSTSAYSTPTPAPQQTQVTAGTQQQPPPQQASAYYPHGQQQAAQSQQQQHGTTYAQGVSMYQPTTGYPSSLPTAPAAPTPPPPSQQPGGGSAGAYSTGQPSSQAQYGFQASAGGGTAQYAGYAMKQGTAAATAAQYPGYHSHYPYPAQH